jgi:hypothetical protein
VGPGPLGVEFDGATVFSHRLIEVALGLPAQAELVVERAQLGFELDGVAAGPDRLVQLALAQQGRADLEVDCGHRWPRRQRGPVEAQSLRRLPLPQRLA